MFNCTNLPSMLNNTYALAACQKANTAGSFVTTTTGELSSHIVSQYNNFQGFASSESSTAKTSGIFQRALPALSTLAFSHMTLKSACASADAFLRGKLTQGVIFGAVTAVEAALTYYSLSMTLDPVAHSKFFNS